MRVTGCTGRVHADHLGGGEDCADAPSVPSLGAADPATHKNNTLILQHTKIMCRLFSSKVGKSVCTEILFVKMDECDREFSSCSGTSGQNVCFFIQNSFLSVQTVQT